MKTKMNFSDIKGILNRDQMKQINGGGPGGGLGNCNDECLYEGNVGCPTNTACDFIPCLTGYTFACVSTVGNK